MCFYKVGTVFLIRPLLFFTGLWYYLEGEDHPCLTLIGSPNFGYRSVHRDLEAQIAIVTENKELQAQLQQVRDTCTYYRDLYNHMSDDYSTHSHHTLFFHFSVEQYVQCLLF